ncbi:YlbL family protein [Microbacterium sp. YY-01]|uniref:YlbL family protein n=1 Tax=Microbacterium sp. YY-01 TaxID=3421634 RepID=UPI003D173862
MAATPLDKEARRLRVGLGALVAALLALLVITFLPSGFVIQQPGPVYNTLGSAQNKDGDEISLIAVDDEESYPTAGALDLTTVQVRGNRDHNASWPEAFAAWLSPAKAVIPVDLVFPQGLTTQQRDERNAALMIDSQHEATAAALTFLGYDVQARITVHQLVEGSPASGSLDAGDTIVAANGTPIGDVETLRAVINDGGGSAVTITRTRDGQTSDVEIVPEKAQGNWVIGVTLTTDYSFPVDVTLQLDNVGGPSAGMMFALGIIDVLTPEELTGGRHIAGTGTIDAAGTVGPIGGIRQKLYGARDAGADFFLAPAANCNEVVGHVPSGLQVVRTETLQQSIDALTVIAEGGDIAALPACE